jgi:hypothetical protein
MNGLTKSIHVKVMHCESCKRKFGTNFKISMKEMPRSRELNFKPLESSSNN